MNKENYEFNGIYYNNENWEDLELIELTRIFDSEIGNWVVKFKNKWEYEL